MIYLNIVKTLRLKVRNHTRVEMSLTLNCEIWDDWCISNFVF